MSSWLALHPELTDWEGDFGKFRAESCSTRVNTDRMFLMSLLTGWCRTLKRCLAGWLLKGGNLESQQLNQAGDLLFPSLIHRLKGYL